MSKPILTGWVSMSSPINKWLLVDTKNPDAGFKV